MQLNTNKLKYMLSWLATSNNITLGTLMHMDPFTHDAYKEEVHTIGDFREWFQQPQGQISVGQGDDKYEYLI